MSISGAPEYDDTAVYSKPNKTMSGTESKH